MVFTFYQKSISIDLFVVGLKVISTTGTILSIVSLLWNKFLWKIPARLQFKMYKIPYIEGTYNVELESHKNGKISQVQKSSAQIIIEQDSENISISLNSVTGTSQSGKVDIIRFPGRYELYYHYYMVPKESTQMKTNPAHDGSAKIIVEKNNIILWEYWTTRGTKGKIVVT